MSTTRTIGLITNAFASHYHTPLIHRIQSHLGERGYRLLCAVGKPEAVADARIAFARVDGWLVINLVTGAEMLRHSGLPIMLISGMSDSLPCVVPDNHGGVSAALEHLIAEGRTRIAFLTYPANLDFRARHATYRDTLARHSLAVDPALVIECESYKVYDAYQAARRAISGGVRFDAVLCANDWLAFGAMRAIQEVGWRIPEDVAVVGFDDMDEAQFSTPPLTSVRQNAVALGHMAVDLLLGQIERGITPPQITAVPTSLVVRQSSASAQRGGESALHMVGYRDANWQSQLARVLAQQAIFPVPLPPDTSVEQIWPGVETLVAALAAVLAGDAAPPEVPHEVWEHLHRLARSGKTLIQIVDLLRGVGVQRIDCTDRSAVERLTRWLMACQEAAMHQQMMANSNQAERDRQIFMSESLLLSQVGSTGTDPRQIGWISQSQADWAVLGLWRGGPAAEDRAIEISSVYARDLGVSPHHLRLAPEQFPPLDSLPAAVRDSLEYQIRLIPLASSDRQWGYLAYAERPSWTFSDMVSQRNAYITTALERAELLDSLQDRQMTLQAAYERERSLADTVRELGCPIIPLLKGVLLVPLVGAIDTARAAQIIERVLEEVSRAQAERVLLDITGVPLVDTQVAAALIQTAQAVGLLGAKVTLVGVRPEIAQSIVGLGVNLGMFETKPVLAAALLGLIGRGGA